ncbi:hypothetical protein ACGF1Z_29155 [Streptomyces sp. NPDC048018]|uniref:LppU/SCO3897 family protein n=1 Tax=Streptomyces sp. NPDC048018 TaxID=3365499 RepID=UPI003724502E
MATPPQQHADPFAATPGAPAPAPEPQKQGGFMKKLGGVLLLLVLVAVVAVVKFGVGFGFDFLAGKTPVHAEVGDCLTITGPDSAPKVDTADCSSGKAKLFKVAQLHEGTFDLDKCDETKYTALAQQYGPDKFVLCVQEVAAK